jgi:hypothetical protein
MKFHQKNLQKKDAPQQKYCGILGATAEKLDFLSQPWYIYFE